MEGFHLLQAESHGHGTTCWNSRRLRTRGRSNWVHPQRGRDPLRPERKATESRTASLVEKTLVLRLNKPQKGKTSKRTIPSNTNKKGSTSRGTSGGGDEHDDVCESDVVFGDEAEDDDGSFELVHETVSPPHAWSAGQPSMPRSQHGSSQPPLHSLRLCLATMVETNKGQPTDIGIDLTEQALTELAEEKGISKEEIRSLLDASTASTAPSTSSASPVATLRPAKRSSTPVQLLPAASSSSSSAMAMAPTQQRMVIPAGESEEEKAEEPKEEATEPAEETKLEEVNQEEAEPLVPAEKEKK